MTDQESFEDKLNRWTLSELKIERTKKNIYGDRKLGRIETRIAELEFGTHDDAVVVHKVRDDLYIATARLENLSKLQSPQFDLRRLVRMCEEINSSWQHGNLIAVAALTRIVLDHVPPIFGYQTFVHVTANASRSLKAIFESLEQNSRKISDSLIHQTIRKKETLPTEQMVNCSQNMDVLLAEIVRIIEEQTHNNSLQPTGFAGG